MSTRRSPSRDLIRHLAPAGRHPDLALADAVARRHGLTRAEQRVLRLFVGGRPRRQLAEDMGITDNTVRTHVRALCRKLEIGSLEQVYRLLLREAILRSWSVEARGAGRALP